MVKKIDAAVAAGRLSGNAAANLTRWLERPEYAAFRPRLEEMIEAEEFERLSTLFFEEIPFGTGGRRGPMADLGSATVNPRTIAESAHGLAVYLRQHKGKQGGRAVVAHDTRNRSPEFARLVATTLAANGLHVFCFDSHRSTPELSFTVRHLGCDVGVMISASHNPPSDNGFKAYWSTGGQVLAPHDQGIIECVQQAAEIPEIEFDEAVAEGEIEVIGEEVDAAYVNAVCQLSLSAARDVPALFTPLHGVGETSVFRVVRQAGFEGVDVFEPQRAPDGNFSNVPDQLPNPERAEVFQPAIEYARETGRELVLASDPDADRLGVSVRSRRGGFVHLTGNRLGALLADYILRKRAEAGTLSGEHYVVQTMVTTPLIAKVARAHGVRVIDDLLVGFKYIGETIDREGADKFLFGAEESLGYLAGGYARDKDAAIAALYLLELAAELRAAGKTLLGRLNELFAEYGYFAETQHSQVCRGEQGQQQIRRLMETFRTKPPRELAGVRFERVRDYLRHEVRSLPKNRHVEELAQPEGDLLIFESAADGRRISLAVRPSGTEPKIKFYLFAHVDCVDAGALSELRRQTDERIGQVQSALCAWIDGVLEQTEGEVSTGTGNCDGK